MEPVNGDQTNALEPGQHRDECGDAAGDLHIGTIVVNVRDVKRSAAFWCAALGYNPREGAVLDNDFAMLQPARGPGVPLSVQRSDDLSSQPVRLHLDLYTDFPEHHRQRLIGLGATLATDWSYPADADFTVLRDPDGNEFCIIPHAELT